MHGSEQCPDVALHRARDSEPREGRSASLEGGRFVGTLATKALSPTQDPPTVIRGSFATRIQESYGPNFCVLCQMEVYASFQQQNRASLAWS